MPLSDHEQRLLEQMERALYAEDPKFADSLRKSHRAAVDRRQAVLGTGVAIIGLAVLIIGMISQLIPLGVLGFLGMLAGAVMVYRSFLVRPEQTAAAAATAAPAAPRRPQPGKPPRTGGFMERMEARWRQRRDQRDQF